MDAPVEELGAPAEPLWPSGAPDLGSATVPVSPGERGRHGAAAGPTFLLPRRGAGLTVGTKASAPPGVPGGTFGLEVGTVMTVFTVDAALESTCATFREQADRGDITPAERDLLIDGAILLAMHIDDLPTEDRAGPIPGWPRMARPAPAGRHERHQSAA